MNKQQTAEKEGDIQKYMREQKLESAKNCTCDRCKEIVAEYETPRDPIPSDAVAFAEWLMRNVYFDKDEQGRLFYRGKEAKIRQTLPELYNIFNPSGAIPQAERKVCMDCHFEIEADEPHIDYGTNTFLCDDCHLMCYGIHIRQPPTKPNPQPAGPVWINAKVRLPGFWTPVKWRNGRDHSQETKGAVSLSDMEKPNLINWQWLDESAPAQQVFSRDNVSDAFYAGILSGFDSAYDRPFITQDEYMNTNYPLTGI